MAKVVELTPAAPPPGTRVATLLALVAIALSAFVFARRAWLASESTHIAPGLAETSGFEEETHFALWRLIHGEQLFLDETKPPFAAAYFNWLFYVSYAAPLMPFAPLDDGVPIVRVARVLTAAGALVGLAVLLSHFRRTASPRVTVAAAFAAFLFAGPLVGWWAHTARPDVGALSADAAAVALFLRYHRPQPWRATLLALGCCFVAWSFKQTYILSLGGILGFLLVRRRWRHATVLSACTVALWALSLLVLGRDYRVAQAANAAGSLFFWSLGLEYAAQMLAKSAPLWIAAAGVIVILIRRPPVTGTPHQDARLLGLSIVAVAAPLSFLATCKLGANVNYYFSLTLGLTVLAGTLPAAHPLSLAALLAMIGLHLGTLAGTLGRLDLSPQIRTLAERWAVFKELPEPRFSADTRLNQPWLNPDSPPLVLSYNYAKHHSVGTRLEGGGVAGLVERGFFASLLLPAGSRDLHGGRLDLYVPGETFSGMTIYRRRSDPTTP